jgi:23S rRNA pseudouridine2457 synthase
MRYFLFNKPFGVLSQFTQDHPGQRTLAEFAFPPEVYAAGRLDADSEGLLLLTDDGGLIKRLLDPDRGHKRQYLVQVEGEIMTEALEKLEAGVMISDYRTKPCAAKRVEEPAWLWPREPPIRMRKSIPTSWIELELTEGKNRQVRRMTAAIGHPTLRLIRTRIGRLELGSLKPGDKRELTKAEIQEISKMRNE